MDLSDLPRACATDRSQVPIIYLLTCEKVEDVWTAIVGLELGGGTGLPCPKTPSILARLWLGRIQGRCSGVTAHAPGAIPSPETGAVVYVSATWKARHTYDHVALTGMRPERKLH